MNTWYWLIPSQDIRAYLQKIEYKFSALEVAFLLWNISYLKMSVTLCEQNKIGCLAVIHGYGSSGKGGAIRAKARQWLNAQVRNGMIKAVINGEDFDVLNFKALELKGKYRELEKLLKVCNHGMTVVEV